VNEKEIIIYHTNDMHGRVSTHDENEKSIGIDRISKIVNLSLLKNKNTFWFDAGDFTHGTPRMTSVSREIIINMLNATPLNAICTGNHDYNLSMENLYQLSKDLNGHVLSANTLDEKTKAHVLLPYMVYSIDLNQDDYLDASGNSNDNKIDNLNIGVFGLSTPETKYKTNPNNVKGIEFANPIETAKNMTELLRKNCHIVIALSHLGLDKSSEFTSERLAKEVHGIDLIIDGHSHTILEHGMKVNNTVIVQAGAHGEFLGKVILKIKDKSIKNISAELLDQNDIDKIISTSDVHIENKLCNIDKIANDIMSRIVAHSNKALPGDRELVRQKEAELGNMVADALRWKTNADIAMINGGTLRTGLPAGDITFKDLISIFPFENKLQIAEIKGFIIKQVLEHSVFSVPASFGGFMDISNMTFSFNINAPVGHKVKNIKIHNETLDLNKTYTIATVDFMFSGGDGYEMLKGLNIISEYGNIENIVAEYLNKFGVTENIKVGRITVENKTE